MGDQSNHQATFSIFGLEHAEKVLVQGLAIQDQSNLGHLNPARVYWERAAHLLQGNLLLRVCGRRMR